MEQRRAGRHLPLGGLNVEGSLTVGSIRGVDIRIHRSWILIALLIGWSFYARFAADDRGPLTLTVMAVAGTILFFGSVLVHELAHSLEARHRGVHVAGITLFLFGGVTETRFDVERPGDEFALTAVGPFSSFVLAAVFGLVATYGAGAGLASVAAVSGHLAWINLALGLFNLLPGAPLDGGRILRSIVWKVTGDRGRAVRAASRTGQVLGLLIAGLGLLQLFFVRGGLVGGLWFVFIGWFLARAAAGELLQHRLRARLGGLTVGELVSDDPLPAIEGEASVDDVVAALRRRPEDAMRVTADGETIGLVGIEDVAPVPDAERAEQRAAGVAVPMDEVATVPVDTEVVDAVGALGNRRFVAVVSDADTVVGLLTREQLQRILKRSLQLDGDAASVRRRPQDHIPGGDRP